jgi:twitching motility protein PilT
MFVTSAIQNMIRTGDLTQIYSMMQTGNADGMLLLEQSLASLFAFGVISRDDATQLVRDHNIFETRLARIQEARGASQPA